MRASLLLLAFSLLWNGIAVAGKADAVWVKAVRDSDGTYRFDVMVSHGDTGWEHYADKWDVVTIDGKVLGTRVLLHPHETEQPFTRSLRGVNIPGGINKVLIRAHDKLHGYGGAKVMVVLPER